VDVTLGGLSSKLNALNTSSIRLVMDVSDLEVGSHTVNLSFEEGNEELEDFDLLNAQADILIEEEGAEPEDGSGNNTNRDEN
jgi:YbbR domain-containing protein